MRSPAARRRPAFTLVEILVATVLTLILIGMVVTIFADVGKSVNSSRQLIDTSDRMRATMKRLQADLGMVTTTMLPPRDPDDGEGYFEYVEGPLGPLVDPFLVAYDDADITFDAPVGADDEPHDSTYGDTDDRLMFTVRSTGEPFVGRFGQKNVVGTFPDGSDAAGDYSWHYTPIQSQTAEVCWFVRGTTLYRRVLLVLNALPDFDIRNNTPDHTHDQIDPVPDFYRASDLSVHQVGGDLDRSPVAGPLRLIPNSLSDLTRREYRYGHQPFVFPHDVRFWGALGLPTLRECSSKDPSYPAGDPACYGYWSFPVVDTTALPTGTSLVQSNVYVAPDTDSRLVRPSGQIGTPLPLDPATQWVSIVSAPGTLFDPWKNRYPAVETDPNHGTLLYYVSGDRVSEDIIMTNVLSFDVRAYDPGAPLIAHSATGVTYSPGDSGYLAAVAGVGTDYAIISYGAYVNLNYLGTLPDSSPTDGVPDYVPVAGAPVSQFFHGGNPYSGLAAPSGTIAASTYDTGSTHYEHDGFDQNLSGTVDEGRNSYDDNGTGGVDDPLEAEAPPPYPTPLRGIQVKIRVFEPVSRQVKEVTVVQDFLPN